MKTFGAICLAFFVTTLSFDVTELANDSNSKENNDVNSSTETDSSSENDEDDPSTRTCYETMWDPRPCTVTIGNYIPYLIVCTNISTAEVLKKVFSRLKDPKCSAKFYLCNSTLTSLPAGVFGNFTFYSIKLKNTSVKTIEPGVLKGMNETLQTVELTGNQFKTFDFLQEAKYLEEVYITNETLEEIPEKAFANMNISYLYIGECPIRTIGNYAFANMTGATIYIMYNRVNLTKIGDYVFSNDLENNDLVSFYNSSLNDNCFSTSTFAGSRIESLVLFNNSITKFEKNIFSSLVNNDKCQTTIYTDTLPCEMSMKWIADSEEARDAFICTCKNMINSTSKEMCEEMHKFHIEGDGESDEDS